MQPPSDIRRIALLGDYLPRKMAPADATADRAVRGCVSIQRTPISTIPADATADRAVRGLLLPAGSNHGVHFAADSQISQWVRFQNEDDLSATME